MELKNRNYLRYSDDLEVIQPDEEKHARETVESMARMNEKSFQACRHATRDAHAKSHAVFKGEIEIYDLPAHLRQGLFAKPAKYPVVIRLSSAPGEVYPDKMSNIRGFAIKIIGVPGEKFLEEEKEALTQDFLLVNYPIIPTGTVQDYHKQQEKLEKAGASDLAETLQNQLLQARVKFYNLIGKEHEPNDFGTPGSHILGDRYFSMAAIRFGDYVAKMCVSPKSENVAKLHNQPMDKEMIRQFPDTFLTEIVSQFFRNEEAEYELAAQLCTDIEKMPIEDGSVQWMEEDSAFQPVAKITIPKQDPYSDARRVYADDVLSFNPFHCLPEHRPLGSIMRVRKLAYETSSKYRHMRNAQPRTEPRSIDEIPD